MTNPLPTDELDRCEAQSILRRKAFWRMCVMGRDREVLGEVMASRNLKGPLPGNFTDKKWQAARTREGFVLHAA